MGIAEIKDIRLVGRAVIGNAFERLPGTYGLYKDAIIYEAPSVYNPDGKLLAKQCIDEISTDASPESAPLNSLLTIPWSHRRGQKITPGRAAASIIAFSDVQGKRVLDEFFPVKEIHTFLTEISQQSSATGSPLTVPEQFAVAMRIANNNPVAAALLAHGAYRAIARGKDTKISQALAFPTEKAVEIAKATADFHTENSPLRDPLGDTYHWWASFAAGLVFTLSSKSHPIQSRLYTTAFYHEAVLTTFVRKTLLHLTSFANHHKDVDRQGLQVGITVGNYLKNQ